VNLDIQVTIKESRTFYIKGKGVQFPTSLYLTYFYLNILPLLSSAQDANIGFVNILFVLR
jgi:hypothetical protein